MKTFLESGLHQTDAGVNAMVRLGELERGERPEHEAPGERRDDLWQSQEHDGEVIHNSGFRADVNATARPVGTIASRLPAANSRINLAGSTS
jgi:hypothetical protein